MKTIITGHIEIPNSGSVSDRLVVMQNYSDFSFLVLSSLEFLLHLHSQLPVKRRTVSTADYSLFHAETGLLTSQNTTR